MGHKIIQSQIDPLYLFDHYLCETNPKIAINLEGIMVKFLINPLPPM